MAFVEDSAGRTAEFSNQEVATSEDSSVMNSPQAVASIPIDRSLNSVDNKRLMSLVKQHKVLYEVASQHVDCQDQRKVREIKEEAWNQISIDFGGDVSIIELMRRYKNIRTAFGRFLRKSIKRHDGRVRCLETSPWAFLTWLKPYIKHKFDYEENENTEATIDSKQATHQQQLSSTIEHRKSSHSSQIPNKYVPDLDDYGCEEKVIGNEYIIVGNEFDSTSASNSPQNCTKAHAVSTIYEPSYQQGPPRKKKSAWTEPNNANTDDIDEDALFLRSLLPQLRRIRPQLKFAVKTNILKILHDGEFGVSA